MKYIAIVGSRQYPKMSEVVDFVKTLGSNTTIISGGASGVDSIAVSTAKELNMPVMVFSANWNKYGRRAGYLRNKTIVEKSDEIVAFWDGASKGTKITIDLAREAKKMVKIFGGKNDEKQVM